MPTSRGTLAFLFWCCLVVAGGLHLRDRAARVRPEIQARTLLVTSLERAVVAARQAAKAGELEPGQLADRLLAHGVQAVPLSSDAACPRLAIRLGPDPGALGELSIIVARGGYRIVRARGGSTGRVIELRARLRPHGERP